MVFLKPPHIGQALTIYYHIYLRATLHGGTPYAAGWAAPLTIPERNAYCAGSIPLLSVRSLNHATAFMHENGFHPRAGSLAVKGERPEAADAKP